MSFVDSDDWIAPDLFERVMQIFDLYNPDIVTYDCNQVNENGEIYATTENIQEGLLTSEKALEELLQGHINNYAVNKVYRKQVFFGVRFPEGRVWEDMAIAYQLFFNAKTVYCYPAQLYFYFRRSDGLSKRINEKALEHIFLARYECHTAIKEKLPPAQKFSLPMVALSARRLYDRSLWKKVDGEILAMAVDFLRQNREAVLTEIKDKKYWLYYKFPRLYRIARIFRHKIGTVIKKVL